jgi:Ca-activated chloride channel family protein
VPKVAALLLLAAMPAQAQSGLDDFQNGNYEKASEAFQEGLKTQPGSHKLQFNAGAAAYKTGDFENAVTHFTDALLAGDRQLKEDASYNLANALVRKGEAATEAEAKKTNWKSAIEHYEETLRLNPENKKAQDNLEITKKLLEDLEKQQQQQDQQNDQQQDQNKDQQDQKDQEQQKNDQQQDGDSSQDKQEKDQQQQDQQENKDQQQEGENEDQKDGDQQQEDKDQQPQDGDSKNESDNGDSDQRPEPVPTPTPGEKKEGELKSSGEQPQPTPASQDPAEAAEAAAAEEKEGEISPNQARALLNSLRGEEQKVNLMEQQTSQEVLRDW